MIDYIFDYTGEATSQRIQFPSRDLGAYAPNVTNDGLDIVGLDRRAVELSAQIVAQAGPADLGRPTPCAAWTLRDLLDHMITQHYGFAAASSGRGGDRQLWQVVHPDTPIAAYAAAADQVITAFAQADTLQRSFDLPEISTTVAFPAAQAISFHFVDYVVHGWDVARALDVPFEVSDDLAEAALVVAGRVPDGENRLIEGAAFRPGVPAPADGTVLDQVLAVLGRSPAWRP
jgi:uncharacterized protein (TIGR03086 family)